MILFTDANRRAAYNDPTMILTASLLVQVRWLVVTVVCAYAINLATWLSYDAGQHVSFAHRVDPMTSFLFRMNCAKVDNILS